MHNPCSYLLHSAVTPLDYKRELFTILSFSACETRQCVDVAIVNDLMNEPEERFGVTLERTPDLDSRIILDRDDGQIFIQNDGKINKLYCSVCGKKLP